MLKQKSVHHNLFTQVSTQIESLEAKLSEFKYERTILLSEREVILSLKDQSTTIEECDYWELELIIRDHLLETNMAELSRLKQEFYYEKQKQEFLKNVLTKTCS